MRDVDSLLHARWVIPVEPDNQVLENHTLVIDQGRILDLLPSHDCASRYQSSNLLHLDQHALIPGLVNAHTHAAMSLLRGLADDLVLMDWLNHHIWPAEQRWVNEEFVHDGSQLAMAEMLRGGTTCFNDMYFFPEITARAASHCGMRACVGLILIDFPTAYASDADDYLSKGMELHDQYRSDPLISTAFAPHAPYTVSDEPLKRVRVLADELEIPIHMHVHETETEVNEAFQKTGMRPLERLQRLGLMSSSLQAVHMTQLDAAEIQACADAGVQIIHCPESNMKLASGFCPVQALTDAGIPVALGTDGAASNNDLDMIGEMRTAALLGKAVSGDASALPAHSILRMATLDGAMALGLGSEIGSLQTGKWADVTAIRLDGPETEPLYHPISQLVYATGRDRVTDVWVAGQHVLKDRQLTTLDIDDILTRTRAWHDKIQSTDPPS